MAGGPRYSVRFRRRRKGKTDYKKRINYLKSKKPRLVVRKSNKYVRAQVVKYDPQGDKTITAVSSKVLGNFGWGESKKNIPAAYLTGLLLGTKSKVQDVILDIGVQSRRAGTRIYAVAKGFKDAGGKVSCNKKMFPAEDRIKGKHINDKMSKLFKKVKKKILSEK